ncbi:hypothetical protein Ahy_A07g032048 [Arachis hypogaea]|uniref:Uncharacterized protein n=1 Tax=Arachis hypogaea TaxID=3818 RepID=A0A445C5Z4_ARAHY|nr:hypothetical protein Ahy_A07g032048 [Arachis hypogaea]
MDLPQFRTEFLPRTLNPSSSPYLQFPPLGPFSNPFRNSPNLKFRTQKCFPVVSFSEGHKQIAKFPFSGQNPLDSTQHNACTRDVQSYAGRSKKKGGGSSGGRIEGGAELRRRIRRNARAKNKKRAESLFYRLKNPRGGNYADNVSEELLQQIGQGYDRMVRFMEKDDPNIRHPYDWYKYGQYGPYSWRGVVVGEPIIGRFTDERVTLMTEVRDHEEWEEIEKAEMAADFGKKVKQLDQSKLRYFWVFIRHPKWRLSELPWQQWTLVCEVVLEAGKQRLDKWNLMGRLGSKARSLIGQCAAWMRPDIIYVKKPVFQCRFEPQDNFFKPLIPLLDPETEQDFLFELENDDGTVDTCTYFGGLCKIVKISQKAFVDDVVNAYQKLSDEKKSKCLEFLLGNHPKSVEFTTNLYKKQLKMMEGQEESEQSADGDETFLRGKRAKVKPEEWKYIGVGPFRKRIRKSKLPPEMFLQAAIRPFTYRNLVKEIVLTRHAILDGEIGRKD